MFVKGRLGGLAAVFAEPIVKGVSHDAQEPRPSVAPAEAVEELEGTEEGVLGDILGIRVIPEKPAGQIVGGVHMRQDGLLKALEFFVFFHGR